jgi:hypothetical protein
MISFARQPNAHCNEYTREKAEINARSSYTMTSSQLRWSPTSPATESNRIPFPSSGGSVVTFRSPVVVLYARPAATCTQNILRYNMPPYSHSRPERKLVRLPAGRRRVNALAVPKHALLPTDCARARSEVGEPCRHNGTHAARGRVAWSEADVHAGLALQSGPLETIKRSNVNVSKTTRSKLHGTQSLAFRSTYNNRRLSFASPQATFPARCSRHAMWFAYIKSLT